MTTNNLETKIAQIKADPHGQVARDASHWLAVHVMGWAAVKYGGYMERHTTDGIFYTGIMSVKNWKPCTNANHTRMVVRKVGFDSAPNNWDAFYLGGYHPLNAYSDDPTHDACQVLRNRYDKGILTLDEINRWGGE